MIHIKDAYDKTFCKYRTSSVIVALPDKPWK